MPTWHFGANIKKRLARANTQGAAWAIILGDDEVAAGMATIKGLITGGQFHVPIQQLLDEVEFIAEAGLVIRPDQNDESGWIVLGAAPE